VRTMLKVFNTMGRKKEVFKPMEEGKVKMFVCGPTVYDFSHLGHAKTYVQFDIIVRWLRYRGYDVYYLMNITDVDDKIIKKAKESGKSYKDVARKFEEEFYKDMKALGVNTITKFARATDYIPQIIKQVETLLEKGYAYITDDGIYFDITKFEDYGKLAGRTSLDAEDSVSRIDESVKKRNKGDFCLWKKSKPGEPKWPSPWFEGRPGWHIEDTAITEYHFGPQYDIHGGARDLIFRHHEAEIAQMEAASGKKPFVRYWLHTGFLTVNGRKMSKSLGNFVTIRDVLKKYDAETLRLFFASSHYRSPIDYKEDSMEQVKKRLERLYETMRRLMMMGKGENGEELLETARNVLSKFEDAMDDDFDTPTALSHLNFLARKVNEFLDEHGPVDKEIADEIISIFRKIGSVFGILQKEIEMELPEEVKKLIKEREELRKKGSYEEADKIRELLLERYGIILEDTKEGTIWKFKPHK